MVTIEELRAVANSVTYPGAPVTLELGNLRTPVGAAPRVTWLFADPGYPDQVVDGVTALADTAEAIWREVQVDAACTFAAMVDADWEPGVALTARHWSPDEAWAALRAHLGAHGDVEEVPGEIGNHWRVLRGVSPESWAAYLNSVDDREPDLGDPDREVVPVGRRHTEHLPLWACDELDHGHGDAPALALVDGELRCDDPERGVLRPGRR